MKVRSGRRSGRFSEEIEGPAVLVFLAGLAGAVVWIWRARVRAIRREAAG